MLDVNDLYIKPEAGRSLYAELTHIRIWAVCLNGPPMAAKAEQMLTAASLMQRNCR